jgi:ATP-binding cassette subfamily B multidrug efflux pump
MKSLRKAIRYLQPYRGWVLAAFGLVVVEALAQLVVPRLLQYVIDQGITPQALRVILTGSLLMLLAAAIGAVAAVMRAVFAARFSQGMAYDMRNDLFKRILTLSFGNLDRTQTGQLITRVSNDVDVVRMFMSMGFMMIIRSITMLFGSIIFLIITDAKLSLIMLGIIPAMAAIFTFLARTAQPLFKGLQERLAVLNTRAQENLAGVEVVKAFVREPHEIERFEETNEAFTRQGVKVYRLMAVAFPAVMLVGNLGMLAVIVLGGMQAISGTLTVGELVAFTNYLMTTMFPIVMLGMIISMVSRADASAERILEVLGMTSDVQEAPASQEKALAGQVNFDNVTFHYNGKSDAHVLHNISLDVKPGQRIAVLGATGSGKTTLVNLIPRFYDVAEGQVLVDGTDVRDLTERSLRSQIGYAMQQTLLFSGTVAENIAFGRPDATREEIEAAARAAQAHDFIMAMPEGYDSHVEARGANLSGGQKQRIAIARALLINPAILILDDSTSSVDMETEFLIQEALDELMEGRTTFIIAQRLSSVLKADRIIILDRGRITAQGTHQELLESSPIYQEIYHSQLQNGTEADGDSKISSNGNRVESN